MSENKDKWSIVKNQKYIVKEGSPTASEDIMSEGNNSEYSFQVYEETDILSSTSGETNSDFERVIDLGEMNQMSSLLSSGPPLDQSNLIDLDVDGNVDNSVSDIGFHSNATLREYQIEQLSNSVAVQRTISNGKRTLGTEDVKESEMDDGEKIETDTIHTKDQDNTFDNVPIDTSVVEKKAKVDGRKSHKRKIKKARLSQQIQDNKPKLENAVPIEPPSPTKSKELQSNTSEEDTKHHKTMTRGAMLGEDTYSDSSSPLPTHPNKTNLFKSKNKNKSTKDRSRHGKDETPQTEIILTTTQKLGALTIILLSLLGTWKFISLSIGFINLYRDNPYSTFSGKEVVKFDWNVEPNEMISETKATPIDCATTHFFQSSLYISTNSLKGDDKLSMEFWKPHGKYLIDFDSEEIYKLDITGMMLNWYDGVVEESKSHYDQFRSLVTKEMNRDSERLSLLKGYLNNMTTRASCNAQNINIKAKSWINKYQEKIFHI